MFIDRYGRVAGYLLLGGVIFGAALFLIVFGLLVPPDRGEEGVVAFMPFMGAFFGMLTALPASAACLLCLFAWTRRGIRSVRSRAWIAAGGAAAGAAVPWLVVGIVSGPFALIVWGSLAAFCALLAAVVAGPVVARASRRADTAGTADTARGA